MDFKEVYRQAANNPKFWRYMVEEIEATPHHPFYKSVTDVKSYEEKENIVRMLMAQTPNEFYEDFLAKLQNIQK